MSSVVLGSLGIVGILLCFAVLLEQVQPVQSRITYQYPRYHYKKKPKVVSCYFQENLQGRDQA